MVDIQHVGRCRNPNAIIRWSSRLWDPNIRLLGGVNLPRGNKLIKDVRTDEVLKLP